MDLRDDDDGAHGDLEVQTGRVVAPRANTRTCRTARGVWPRLQLALGTGLALMAAMAAPAVASATTMPASSLTSLVHVGRTAPEIPGCLSTRPGCASNASSNWSGYAQKRSAISISATWVVPSVSSTGSTTSDSSTWVGIDGFGNSSLIQTGTEQGWNGSTHSPFYQAWWEILPAAETITFGVSPGDNIAASIQKITVTNWSIFLEDRNSGKTISLTKTYSGPQSSAEFIQEAPTSSTGSVLPLAHYYRFVDFYNARINGASPFLNTGQSIVMAQNGVQVSTPSVPNQAANGFEVVYGSTAPAAPPTPAFQRHSNGSVWVATGVACNPTSCPGWVEIDHNPTDVQISAGAGSVFQLLSNGQIWEWTGANCFSGCPGWIELDNDPAARAIAAGSGWLYELLSNGSIWRSTGVPCNGSSCTGWVQLDNNSATKAIAPGGGTVFQLHSNGSIWRSTGVACSGTSCTGWTELDNNPASIAISANASTVYSLHSDGSIWRSTGVACSGASCPGWTKFDNNAASVAISAGGSTVYQLHSNGSIWRSTGVACSGSSCPGWTELDNNPASVAIAASHNTVYQLHSNRSIWISTGVACSGASCPGWTDLDNNSATTNLTVSNGS